MFLWMEGGLFCKHLAQTKIRLTTNNRSGNRTIILSLIQFQHCMRMTSRPYAISRLKSSIQLPVFCSKDLCLVHINIIIATINIIVFAYQFIAYLSSRAYHFPLKFSRYILFVTFAMSAKLCAKNIFALFFSVVTMQNPKIWFLKASRNQNFKFFN